MRISPKVAAATASVYLLAFPLTAVGVLLGCLAALARWRSFIRRGTVVWAHLVFLLAGSPLRVRGRENVPRGGPVLVVSNHASMFDIPALMGALPGIAIMGRDYLGRIPVFGLFIRSLGFVPIDTGSARSARDALARAGRQVRSGQPVAIFAEGTRTTDGRVQPLKRGFVAVLRASGADLLPVHVGGTFAMQPKGRHTVTPCGRVPVAIGTPLPHASLAGMPDGDIMTVAQAALVRLGEDAR